MARHLTVLAHPAPTAPATPQADSSDHSAPLSLVGGPPLASAPASERAGPAAGARAESQGDTFTDGERQALLAVARAVIPAGEVLPAGGARAVAQVERFFGQTPAAVLASYRAALGLLRGAARLRHGRALPDLTDAQVLALCQAVRGQGFSGRSLMRLLTTPLKVAHVDDPAIFRLLHQPFGARAAPVGRGGPEELPRGARERAQAAAEVPRGEVLECDVVVIGSGAGGAVAARELAEAGHAVILLEEGPLYTRSDFTGRSFEMQRKLYRDLGATVALGDNVIPVPVGRAVGGTTLVNSGTCYRPPARVLRAWKAQGLPLSEEELAPYLERVEAILGVAPPRPELLGGIAELVARGAQSLGYRHGPLRRNAPDCDGQGSCVFGCPTDAKRSTNVSYVPAALRAGAQLFSEARVSRVLIEGGRAVGVAVAGDDGDERFQVRARAVVLAAGALMTPVLLQAQEETRRLLGRSGQLGRNLSIHPAAAVFALMKDPVHGAAGIPQGYAIEEFHDEGLLMEGVYTPLDLGAATLTPLGPLFTAAMEGYERLASFGFMVEDEGRGVVRPSPLLPGMSPGPRRPVITYRVGDRDAARVKRGIEILARLFLRVGAQVVLPLVQGFDEIRDEAGLGRLRAARLRPRDFELTAYHPLGTARMGLDPRTSVVDSDHQAHDLPGLYLCDGSVLPTSPAVNPQITIMALATRAARRLADRL